MHADNNTDGVWEQLRATRWNPPAPAVVVDERRATYVFALEQAEQMFRAAATVGPATQPLLVFYGLSQAGRAITAASSSIGPGDGWKLSSHGISAKELAGGLSDVRIETGKPGGSGSYVRLSELLDSPVWGKASIPLNVLWDLLPENQHSPLLGEDASRRTPLWIEYRNLYPENHPLASVPVVGFPSWVMDADNGRQALDNYLKAFPAAQGYHSFVRVDREPAAAPDFSRHNDGWGELVMHWQLPGGHAGTVAERAALLESLTRRYIGSMQFFPSVAPDDSRSLHPLMAWWTVLYALSMLARYQPAEWASHINVDTSRHAVAIERLLKDAVRVVPSLVLETIGQVSAEPEPGARS
ncbi:YaaC family protein [Promicromonospora thailandica]|uniref:YaaC family protein n=1 Tax=Promicromonospora thailandica TaxID=765201 RepID=UPI0020A347DE|nr:YaaC family protein [Promicromonospora thailandica]BFF20298.1 hypothetical protein GCM10025730_38190 [Promicromonospora thailandica]